VFFLDSCFLFPYFLFIRDELPPGEYGSTSMMAKFVLILYVPGIPALSMSDIDFDFGKDHKKQPKPRLP